MYLDVLSNLAHGVASKRQGETEGTDKGGMMGNAFQGAENTDALLLCITRERLDP
jgi:hypothetical protein